MNYPITKLFLAVATSTSCFLTSASAIDINFEAGEGYSTGSIIDEPSVGSTWTGSYTGLSIVDDGGNQIAQTPGSDPTNFQVASFTPSSAELGGSNAASGQYSFSFDLRSDNNPGTSNFTTAAIIRIGASSDSDAAIRLNIFDNGRIQYFDGGTSRNVLTGAAANFDFDSAAGFTTLSGVIDFDTQTFSLNVAGIDQLNGTSGTSIAFNQLGQTGFGGFRFSAGNTGATDYRQLSMDNLSLSVVPEPSAAAILAGLFALGAVTLRRRSR